MAGFSSRLREKIESNRSSYATGNVPSNYQPMNIRGLTRLGVGGVLGGGGVAPASGGLLSGRNSTAGGAHTGSVAAVYSVPLPIQPIQTSSLRQENREQDATVSLVHQPPPRRGHTLGPPTAAVRVESNTALLGGSKIVPGWDVSSSSAANNAPSGHLGGIKARAGPIPRDVKQRLVEELLSHTKQVPSMIKRVPWALHQPSSPPSDFSQFSVSRRRWGDEEDDDNDEDFPRIGARPPATNGMGEGDFSHKRRQGRHRVGGGRYDTGIDWYRGSGWKEKARNVLSDETCKYQLRCCQTGLNCDDEHSEYFHRHRDESVDHSQQISYGNEVEYNRRVTSHRNSNRNSASNLHSADLDKVSGDWEGKNCCGLYDRRRDKDSRDPVRRMHSHIDGSRKVAGSVSRSKSHGFDDFDGCRHSDVDYPRGGSEGVDRSDDGHGYGQTRNNHCLILQSRYPGVVKQNDVGRNGGSSSRGKLTHYNQKSLQDLKSGNRGTLEAQLSRACSPERASCSPFEQHRMHDKLTPLVVLQSNEIPCNDQTSVQEIAPESADITHISDKCLEGHLTASSIGTQLGKLERYSHPGDPSDAPQGLVSKCAVRPHGSSEERKEQNSEYSMVGVKLNSLPTCNLNPVHIMFCAQSHGEMEQGRKDRVKEQQQNILRQVAERRAAAAAAVPSLGDTLSDEYENDIECTKGTMKSNYLDIRKEVDVLMKGSSRRGKDGPNFVSKECTATNKEKAHCEAREGKGLGRNICPKKGYNHQLTECPSNHKSEVPYHKTAVSKAKSNAVLVNLCRIEGHNHEWNICSNNPKSDSFIRNNPCRIDGHEHDWIDCVENPKSDNCVRPNSRQILKGFKFRPHRDLANWTDGYLVQDSGQGLSLDSKGPRNVRKAKNKKDFELTVAKLKAEHGRSDTKLASQNFHELLEPTAEKNNAPHHNPFVPAPAPAVSAWMSGLPPAITQNHSPQTLSSAIEPNHLSKYQTCSFLDRQQTLLPFLKEQATAYTVSPKVSHEAYQDKLSFPASHKNASKPMLPLPGAVSPGNYALFGNSFGSCAVYSSWNSPPMVISSNYFDLWKSNLFAQTPGTAQSFVLPFGSIWGEYGVSIDSSGKNITIGEDICSVKAGRSLYIEPFQSDDMGSMGVSPLNLKFVKIDNNSSKAGRKCDETRCFSNKTVLVEEKTLNNDNVATDVLHQFNEGTLQHKSKEGTLYQSNGASNYCSCSGCDVEQEREFEGNVSPRVPLKTYLSPKHPNIQPGSVSLVDKNPISNKRQMKGNKIDSTLTSINSDSTAKRQLSSIANDKREETRLSKKLSRCNPCINSDHRVLIGKGRKHMIGKLVVSKLVTPNDLDITSVHLAPLQGDQSGAVQPSAYTSDGTK